MRSVRYVFLGEALTDLGLLPLFVPIATARIVRYEEIAKLRRVLEKLDGAPIGDGTMVVATLYTTIVIVAGENVELYDLAEFRTMLESGSVGEVAVERVEIADPCDLLRIVHPVTVSYAGRGRALRASTYPIMALFRNGYLHLSLTPLKLLKRVDACYRIGNVAVVSLDAEIPPVLPVIRNVMDKPTVEVLQRKCFGDSEK